MRHFIIFNHVFILLYQLYCTPTAMSFQLQSHSLLRRHRQHITIVSFVDTNYNNNKSRKNSCESLFSSFSNLSGYTDDIDDKIKIVLDVPKKSSLTTSSSSTESRLEEMLETMAIPLKLTSETIEIDQRTENTPLAHVSDQMELPNEQIFIDQNEDGSTDALDTVNVEPSSEAATSSDSNAVTATKTSSEEAIDSTSKPSYSSVESSNDDALKLKDTYKMNKSFSSTESTTAQERSLIQTTQPSPNNSFIFPSGINVDFGIVGGFVTGISIYLALAAYLKRVDTTDKGYAEWDQLKRETNDYSKSAIASTVADKEREMVDVDTALDAAITAIEDAVVEVSPSVEVLEESMELTALQSSSLRSISQNAESESVLQSEKAVSQSQPSIVEPTRQSFQPLDMVIDAVKQQEKLSTQIEQGSKEINGEIPIVSMSVENKLPAEVEVRNIEQYCEPQKVNAECSQSLSNYLDSLSSRQVKDDTQKVAAKKIISYLDSLSSSSRYGSTYSNTVSGTAGPKVKIVKSFPTQTGAAFSSYLDALSIGSVAKAPSAKAVAGYLDRLSSDAATFDTKETSQMQDMRISGVEERLNQLESSVETLPDNIAKKLIELQMRQDEKFNNEIDKITKYLMDAE